MIVTYARTGGETSTWTYDADEVPSSEAEELERVTDKTFAELNAALIRGAVYARRAILWMLMKRDNPNLRYRDVAFKAGEVVVDWDDGEKAEMRAAISAAPGFTDEEREEALAVLGSGVDEPADQAPKGAPARSGKSAKST